MMSFMKSPKTYPKRRGLLKSNYHGKIWLVRNSTEVTLFCGLLKIWFVYFCNDSSCVDISKL